jgi:mRNA-degrading endonuclease RelE of RelBE toxin-antitoxin system
MDFRIADTFTDSLARLTGDEQKAVKTTVFDLQVDPSNPGHSFHKLDKAKDKNFWSVRATRDIRIIVHRTEGSLLICYVAHHDSAYQWAERRKLETHPKTGAAQLVEIRETVQEIRVPVYVQVEEPAPPARKKKPAPRAPAKSKLFVGLSDDQILSYGVPSEWLADVRVADEDSLFVLAQHLPAEAADALLELATGGTPRITPPQPATASPFDHPDAQRRFRIMSNVEELERALEYPWDKWTVFLHPDQRQLVEKRFNGPAKVSGSAGTGKTIVALHRAVHLARNNTDARVLLTTFSSTLANALRTRLRRLIGNEPQLGERLEVHAIESMAMRLHKLHLGECVLASDAQVRHALAVASKEISEHKFTLSFLHAEWLHVVDARQIDSWDGYRDVPRLGRKTRLKEPQRLKLWVIFDRVRNILAAQKLTTPAGMYTAVASALEKLKRPPFDFVVVDEAQDVSIAQLRMLAAMGKHRPDALFFAGDTGQRIFQQPFSWAAFGVDMRGRSKSLKVNYRTSHQIRKQADQLLDASVTDADGNAEKRNDTISVFNGPVPAVRTFADAKQEGVAVGEWLKRLSGTGLAPHELGVFVRSEAEVPRAIAAVTAAGLPHIVLDEYVDTISGKVAIGTMHLAKGLEFRAVAVMACDDDVLPLQARIEAVGDEGDLDEAYNTERQLLYVACTRARDHLLVSGREPASEFLDDLTAP